METAIVYGNLVLFTVGTSVVFYTVRHLRLIQCYLIVPTILGGAHTLGLLLQLFDYGPEWAQNHLHNVGVVWGSTLVAVWVAFRRVSSLGLEQIKLVRLTPVVWAMATALAIINEFIQVTFRKEQLMTQGYSGAFDWADAIAYCIGLAMVTANYYAFRAALTRTR